MKLTVLRFGRLALLFWFCIVIETTQAASQPKDLVELPVLTIRGSWVEVTYSTESNGRINEVVVSEVTPHSPPADAGLRVGDELMSIGKTPVVGMSIKEFSQLYESPVPKGQSKVYEFRGYRGWLYQTQKILRFSFSSEGAPGK
ncbi:MAG: PDZ domain-containing protein [Opitutus sp.]